MGARSRAHLRAAAFATLLFVGLFVARVVLYDLVVITPEACHTGGIAAEILDHGWRLPFRAYTPETYENGIVIAGALAAQVMRVLGRTALSLELYAHVFAVLSTLMGLAVLERVMDRTSVGDPRTRAFVQIAFVTLTALAPPLFTYKMLDPTGDHNEGTALGMTLLVLMVRRMEQPASRARFAALWVAAGLAAFWEKGALMAAAVAGVHEILALRHGRLSWRGALTAPLLFLIAYSPALAVHGSTGFADVAAIAAKFGGGLGTLPMRLVIFAVLSGAPPFILVGFVVAVGAWVRLGLRDRRWDSPIPYLGGYVALHFGLVLVSNNTIGTYFLYGFPLWTVILAVLTGRLAERVAVRFPSRPAVVHGGMVLGVAILAAPKLHFDLGRLAALSRDEAGASCAWRFGRAFGLVADDPSDTTAQCRALGGQRSLECISGIPYGERRSSPELALGRDEALAFAFGMGRAFGSNRGRPACTTLDDTEARAVCERGQRWECFAYADMGDHLLGQTALGRPSCDVDPPFPAPYFVQRAHAWLARPQAPYDPNRFDDPACAAVLTACVGQP